MSYNRSDLNANVTKVCVGGERSVSTAGEWDRKTVDNKCERRRSPILSTIFDEAGLSSHSEHRGSGDASTSEITVDKKWKEDVKKKHSGSSPGSSLFLGSKLVKNTARKGLKSPATFSFRSPVKKQTARKTFRSSFCSQPCPTISTFYNSDTSILYEDSLLSRPVELEISTCFSDDKGFDLVQCASGCYVSVKNISSPLDGRNRVLISEEYWLKNEWTEPCSALLNCRVRGCRAMVKSTDGSKTYPRHHEKSDVFCPVDRLTAESVDPEMVCSDSELIKTSIIRRCKPQQRSSGRQHMAALNLDGGNWSFYRKRGGELCGLSIENRAPGSSLPVFRRYRKRTRGLLDMDPQSKSSSRTFNCYSVARDSRKPVLNFNEKLETSKMMKMSSVRQKRKGRPPKLAQIDGSNEYDLQIGVKTMKSGTFDTFNIDSELLEISQGETSDVESDSFPDKDLSEHDMSMETPVKSVVLLSEESKVQPSPEQTRRTLASISTWRKRQIKVTFIDENDVQVFGTRMVIAKSGKRGRPRHIKQVFCRENWKRTEIEKAGLLLKANAHEAATEVESTVQPPVGRNETPLRDEKAPYFEKKSLIEMKLPIAIDKVESEIDKSILNGSIGMNCERSSGREKKCSYSLVSQSLSFVDSSDTALEVNWEPTESVPKTVVPVKKKRVVKFAISSSPTVRPPSDSPSECIVRKNEPHSSPKLSPSKVASPKLSLPPRPTRKTIATVAHGSEGSDTDVASDVAQPVSMARWLTLAGRKSEDELFRDESPTQHNQNSRPRTGSVPKPMVGSVESPEAAETSVKPLVKPLKRIFFAESVRKSTSAPVEPDAFVLGENMKSPATEPPSGFTPSPSTRRKEKMRKRRRCKYEPLVWLPVEEMRVVRDKAFRTDEKQEWTDGVVIYTASSVKNKKPTPEAVTKTSDSLTSAHSLSDEVQWFDTPKATRETEKADEINHVDDSLERRYSKKRKWNAIALPENPGSSPSNNSETSTSVKMLSKSKELPMKIKCGTLESVTEKCCESHSKREEESNDLGLVVVESRTRDSLEMVVMEGKKHKVLLVGGKQRSKTIDKETTMESNKRISISSTMNMSIVEDTRTRKRVEELTDVHAFSSLGNTAEMSITPSLKLEEASDKVVKKARKSTTPKEHSKEKRSVGNDANNASMCSIVTQKGESGIKGGRGVVDRLSRGDTSNGRQSSAGRPTAQDDASPESTPTSSRIQSANQTNGEKPKTVEMLECDRRRSRSPTQSNRGTRASKRAVRVETGGTSAKERQPIELSKRRKCKSTMFASATDNVSRSKRCHVDIVSKSQDPFFSKLVRERTSRFGIEQENKHQMTESMESENIDGDVDNLEVGFQIHTGALATPFSFAEDSSKSVTGPVPVKPELSDIKPVIDAVLLAGPISPVKYHFSEFVDNTFDHGTDDLQEYISNICIAEDSIEITATRPGNSAGKPCRNNKSKLADNNSISVSVYDTARPSNISSSMEKTELSSDNASAMMECTNHSNCSLDSTVISTSSTLNDSVRDLVPFPYVSGDDRMEDRSEDFQSPGYRAEQARARIQRLREKLLTQQSVLKSLKM